MSANSAERLLQHYVDKSRVLPWRSPPGAPAPDPYHVWLSEVMLQQTSVAAVAPRFERFVRRWPNIEALAAAADEDVLGEWAGLGYYARARNLIACAREVAALGGFPDTEDSLRSLPGIGAYTAAAIAAIAFGRDSVAIDSNVERVAARLNAFAQPSRAQLKSALASILPPGRAGDFAQALMDLGAMVCRPRTPLCGGCPLRCDCLAFASGEPERFPGPKARKARPRRFGTAYWVEEEGAVWLVRRPPSGLLGGMAALPGGDWTKAPDPAARPLARVRHAFTHFTLELSIVESSERPSGGWRQPIAGLSEAGLPTLYRRAARAVLAA